MATRQLGVLISEDEVDINNLLTLILQSEDFLVFQAFDGQTALDLFSVHQDEVDLVVTDLGLPRLGGVDLIAKIREMKPSIRIIGASGFGRNNVREEVKRAGADEFLAKPYVTSDLVASVKRLLGIS
ncbi:MAG: response regulator [Ignavibacteriae bacterium]|nr:response regulator [Ignavibacteriota bacterium]